MQLLVFEKTLELINKTMQIEIVYYKLTWLQNQCSVAKAATYMHYEMYLVMLAFSIWAQMCFSLLII